MRIDKELVRRSRQADLKTYFEQRGYALKKEGRKGHYRVVGHQGLIIKNNMFYQFGTGEKGNSLDCLVNVLGLGFREAVEQLLGQDLVAAVVPLEPVERKELVLPARAAGMKRVFAYLCKTRCLDKRLVQQLVKERLLYQDTKGNCVFVWDEGGEVVGAEVVGTLDKVRFKGVARGSKYARGFTVEKGSPDKAYFFESAIDLLSFMQLYEGCPKLDDAFFVSMAGLKPAVVEHYLQRYGVRGVICVDNGPAGEAFAKVFEVKAEVIKPKRKDWNDDLKEKNMDRVIGGPPAG